MSDFMHDPDSLAKRLDELLPPGEQQVPSQVDAEPLVELAARLSAAPKLAPSADALARIQAKMNAAMPQPTTVAQPKPASRKVNWLLFVAAAAAVLIVALAAILIYNPGRIDQVAVNSTRDAINTADYAVFATETANAIAASSTPEVTLTEQVIIPSATFTEIAASDTPAPIIETSIPTVSPTDTAEVPTSTPTEIIPTAIVPTATEIIPTATEGRPTQAVPTETEIIPTATWTEVVPTQIVPTETEVIPTATPTNTPQPGNIIIEGQVDEIRENVVIIYGIDVPLDPDEPLLKVIRVDDFVRIEGSFEDIEDKLIIEVFTIELVTEDGEGIDLFVNPNDPGQVWRDSGDCSNPPPPWAPAVGWRKRCEGGGNNPGGGNNGGNNGNNGNQGNNGNNGNDDKGNNGKGNDDDD